MAILDENLKLIKRKFKGDDSIKKIPMHETMEELCEYVSTTYFSPDLGLLVPYAYAGKQGKGRPDPVDGSTTLVDMKSSNTHRRVQWPRMTLYAKADMGELIMPRLRQDVSWFIVLLRQFKCMRVQL